MLASRSASTRSHAVSRAQGAKKSLPADEPREDFHEPKSAPDYGVGEDVVVLVDSEVLLEPDAGVAVAFVVFVVELEELEPPPAGDGFTTVVLFSVLEPGDAPGAVVSVFCSHATRSAAPARMQIYFFIMWLEDPQWVKA